MAEIRFLIRTMFLKMIYFLRQTFEAIRKIQLQRIIQILSFSLPIYGLIYYRKSLLGPADRKLSSEQLTSFH